ncbi:MAG: kynureninase [Gammaproteobacteria bacterium]|nr:kynureninase [Gammaproteobacteria bacterium]
MTKLTRAHFENLDKNDSLAPLRKQFSLAKDLIYLDGNSLGVLPAATAEHVQRVITQQWGQDLIRSWNSNQWMQKPTQLGDKIGHLIGAEAGQVLACDTTSINIFKLAAAAVKMRPGRSKLITETGNFATDLYLLQGLAKLLGDPVHVVALPREQVLNAIDDDTALVLLTHVHFKTGAMWDMPAVTQQVQQHDALMMWDLCHSVGAMPIHLDQVNADLAVGCTYKYLNGGPGSPAFVYVAKRHHHEFEQPLTGWLGHAKPFEFKDDYQGASGIQQAMCGTPAVLANAALEVALDVMLQADLNQVRQKSSHMGDLFIQLVQQRCPCFEIGSPVDKTIRGSQVSLIHDQGYAIIQALIERNIIGDFRAPDHLRFGFTPLYLRYVDLWDTVDALVDIMAHNSWNQPKFLAQQAVT